MSNPLGHSALTAKSFNDNIITENVSRSLRAGQKYFQQKDDKISFELEYMRFQQQYRKQLSVCEQHIHELRLEVDRQQQILRQAQNRQLQHKQQINSLQKQNLKLYQENQKNKKMVNTLKSDNQALQLEIERWKSDRKTYSNKLDSIYDLKKGMNVQILQKNTLIEEQQTKIREIQKKLTQYKLKTEQLSSNLNEKQRQNKQISAEVRNHLQGYLETQNLASRLQHQLNELNDINMALKDKLNQLQKDKQILLQRIYNLGGDRSDRSQEKQDYDDNQSYNPTQRHVKKGSKLQSPELENIISPTDERLMLQIQSFMREFENLLDRKNQQRQTTVENNQKIVNAVECLSRNV